MCVCMCVCMCVYVCVSVCVCVPIYLTSNPEPRISLGPVFSLRLRAVYEITEAKVSPAIHPSLHTSREQEREKGGCKRLKEATEGK